MERYLEAAVLNHLVTSRALEPQGRRIQQLYHGQEKDILFTQYTPTKGICVSLSQILHKILDLAHAAIIIINL